MNNRRAVLLLMGGAFFFTAGCNSNTEKLDRSRSASGMQEAPAATPAPQASEQSMGDGSHASSNGLAWEVPAGFRQETPSSSMRAVQYRIPSNMEGVKDGELAVFFFGVGTGGGAQDNLIRWASQFKQEDGSDPMQKAKTATLTSSGGLKVTTIELSGRYESSMMGGGPSYNEPGWRLYGAVVEGQGGPWFFKAVGPEAVIQSARSGLEGLFKGLHPAHS